jgi:hypothetical protein
MKYSEAKQFNPSMKECFFAFSNSQFEEGKAKAIPEGAKVLSANHGLYGTDEGITNFMEELSQLKQTIIDNCDPQDVYNYEFGNHECGYTGNDQEALDIVHSFFPDAVVKRFPAELMEDY